ncbi:MAG: hypothetical protein IKV98_05545 [Clostridia bacterium]|nr:hypothetical protein [Clostridia bacterium]
MDNYIILALLSAVFGIFIFVRETRAVKQLNSFGIINLFGYMYGLTYGILPTAVLLTYKYADLNLSHGYYMIDYTSVGLKRMYVWFFLSIVGYAVIQITYKFFLDGKYSKIKNSIIEKDPAYFLKEEKNGAMLGTLQICILICFIVACVSMYLWLRAYDGFWGLIKIADQVRDGVSDVKNPLAFFLRPAKMITTVFFMSMVLVKKKYNRDFNFVIMCVSFVLSVLMLLALDGRLAMVMYLIVMVLLAGEFFKVGGFSSKKLLRMVIIGLLALAFVMNMDSFTFFLRNGYWRDAAQSGSAIEDTLLEFTYIITGAQHAVQTSIEANGPILIGEDIVAGLFAWVPSSLRPDGIINIWDYNTELCTIGNYIYGQLPCDFITTSIYYLGVAGPLVNGIFWGIVIKTLDYFHLKNNNSIQDIFYYALSMRIFRLVNYCLLYDFVLGIFDIFLAYVIWKACTIIRWE